jgi:GxxExxY protein
MLSRIDLKHARITERLIGLFFEVYRELGHGFLESVYEEAFAVALAQSGMRYSRQVAIAVWFRGSQVGQFKADAVVEDAVLVELKAAKQLTEAHQTQLINYLNAADIEVGLLFNFGPHPKFLRRVLENDRTANRGSR